MITNEQLDAREGDAAEAGQLEIFTVRDSIEAAEVDLAEVPKLVQKVKRDGFVWLHLDAPMTLLYPVNPGFLVEAVLRCR